MKKEKLYFRDSETETCYTLSKHIEDAEEEGLDEITLIEADLDTYTNDVIYCHLHLIVDKCDCSKARCESYKSKSGRGRCYYKGNFYTHGKLVTFKI